MDLRDPSWNFNDLDPNHPSPNPNERSGGSGSGSGSSGSGPEPLKHAHSHYWTTRPSGYIMERWVVGRDETGRIVHQVELMDRQTGERHRKKVRRYEKLPTLLKIAGGGGMAAVRKPAEAEGEIEGEAGDDEAAEGGEARKRRKCLVM